MVTTLVSTLTVCLFSTVQGIFKVFESRKGKRFHLFFFFVTNAVFYRKHAVKQTVILSIVASFITIVIVAVRSQIKEIVNTIQVDIFSAYIFKIHIFENENRYIIFRK